VLHPDAAQFSEAWRAIGGDQNPQGHDIAFGLWGLSTVEHLPLEAAGRDLSRESLVGAAERLRGATASGTIKALPVKDVFSRLTYAAGRHFGADQSHLLWADCRGLGTWNYLVNGQFRSGF
jgi:hypothetical protein